MAKLRAELKKDKLDSYIKKIEHIGDDKFKEPLDNSGRYFLIETDKRFRSETSPFGIKWKKLSEYTLMMRRNKDNNSVKILQDTGRLRQSITSSRSGDSVYRNENGVLEVGTAVEYASDHQFGLPFRKPPLPQRSFMGLNEKDQKTINRIFLDWHDKLMEKGGI